MQKDDMSLLTLGDIRTSVALLTRIPVKAEFERSAESAWAYPLAGLVVGVLSALFVGFLLWLGFAPTIAAGFWIATTVVLTGAMHEDGLADCADGFWGGYEKVRRLEIMKDSQIGSYGVLALIISVALRWVAIAALLQTDGWFWSLIAVETLSRAAMPAIMHSLPHARDHGLSHSQGRPPMKTACLAIGLALAIGLILLGWVVLKLTVLMGLTTLALRILAQRKIGGQTGDVLGATQQMLLVLGLITIA